MTNHIVGIPLERDCWKLTLHPFIKGVMQEQICQQGTHDSALGSSFVARYGLAVWMLYWAFKPSFNIQQNPPTICMLTNGFHHELMINVIKEPFDIQI
jgi:hypothetical protein